LIQPNLKNAGSYSKVVMLTALTGARNSTLITEVDPRLSYIYAFLNQKCVKHQLKHLRKSIHDTHR